MNTRDMWMRTAARNISQTTDSARRHENWEKPKLSLWLKLLWTIFLLLIAGLATLAILFVIYVASLP